MLKYNYSFVASNIYGNVIAFMGYHPLEGRPWVFKIPHDKPWDLTEIKFMRNSIQIHMHFSQEGNLHTMWDTIGNTNLTTRKLPRLAVVEWLSEGGVLPNCLRVWLEDIMIIYCNFQKEDWGLLFKFAMSAAQIYPNENNSSFLAM